MVQTLEFYPPPLPLRPLISWPAAVIGKSALDCCASPFALIGFILADWESAYIKPSEKKKIASDRSDH